ncbi:MAG: hypothetical protein B6I20_12130 [Bacteroidetes bacterium 4572_117]|nr:MAG: hypothetical protein B6I20_12130 [Bacteroidetes bacterium 4572_117]
MDKNKLDDKQMISLFKVLTNFSYDSYIGEVLQNATQKMSLNNNVLDAFFAVIKSMSYNSEMEKAVLMFMEKPNLSDYAISAILKSATLFSYDSSKVKILKSVKKHIKGKPSLKAQFKLAVKGISSDSEYRKLMNGID